MLGKPSREELALLTTLYLAHQIPSTLAASDFSKAASGPLHNSLCLKPFFSFSFVND